jgi:aminoglycoside phosphotransferase (APT) family kinase protein
MPALPMDDNVLTARVSKAVGSDVEPVTPLSGGASSLVYSTKVIATGREVVVKSCQPGLQPTRNRDMLRQSRVHKALAGTAVPVPAIIAEDEGDPPEVPPFFAMEKVAGDCVEIGFAADGTFTADEVRGRQLATCRLMAELHKIEPASVGLDDEPVTTLEAEVQRWTDALNACDEDLRAGTEDIGERLLAVVPGALPSRILHGDFRTGNELAEGDRITSVIDWEIWSRSDPRIDLAWFLIFTEDERRAKPAGMPSVSELLDLYESSVGTTLEDLDWFRALVRYKQVAAGAFITRNARRRGQASEPVDNSTNWLVTSSRALLS